jgi:hypothetical protein
MLRLFSALPVLFVLGSGVSLKGSTQNSMGHDLQNVNMDVGPTWEQWRWGPQRSNDIYPMGRLETTLGRPAQTPIYRVQHDDADYRRCARFDSPLSEQFDPTLDLDLDYKHMLLADHIYVLCVQCGRLTFPSSWEGKVSMLFAKAADTCLNNTQLIQPLKATSLHKLALWAAKEQQLRTVMVLEEDFTLPINEAGRNPDVNHTALDEFINSDSWGILRFGHMPYDFMDGDRCKRQCLCLRERLSFDVCSTPEHCDIRSTVAYMVAVRGSIVDDILHADGIIDFKMFQGFKQAFVVPAMIHQSKHWYDQEVQSDNVFRAHCVAG